MEGNENSSTVSGKNLIDISPRERRLVHVPVKVSQASEAMRVLDQADGLDMISANIVL